MQTINFCRNTRKRYARELKLVKRELRVEAVKKAKDETQRALANAKRVSEELKPLSS